MITAPSISLHNIHYAAYAWLAKRSRLVSNGRGLLFYALSGQSVKHLLQPFARPAQTLLGLFHGSHRTQQFNGAGR
jgi:hypothetical protein